MKQSVGLVALVVREYDEAIEFYTKTLDYIIATHSPVILAFPEAAILSFDGGRIHAVKYDQLEHVNLTRDFLNNPQSFLRHL